MLEPRSSATPLLLVWATLLGLLLASFVAYLAPIGRLGVLVNFGAAGAKTALIVMFFMHARGGPRLNWVFAGLGFYWFAILFSLALSDFATRAWLPMPGK